MTKISINKTSLQISSRDTLAAGNVNSLSVGFRFLDGWDRLAKTAIFKNGSNSVSVLLDSDICPIPWEVLQEAGELYVSLRGTTSGGELVLCTENALIGNVKPSLAAAIVAEQREATPDVIDTLVDDVEQLKNNSGSGTGGSNGKSAYELAVENGYEGTVTEWLASLKGEDGINGTDGANGINGHDGADGENGYTPVRDVDYWTDADKEYIVNEVLSNFVDVSEVGA
ncbi:MAG: hypothetical protein Q4A83_03225 [Bacillota bacterium]|nr:hypothetical protein [Bacillota bacterium]